MRSALPALRSAYLGEVEQLAEELRPRFESGELRDLDDSFVRLVAQRFGCDDRDGSDTSESVFAAACLICIVSPAAVTYDGGDPRACAGLMAAEDVLRFARKRGCLA